MAKYQKGETVICWRNVKDEDGNYTDPANSMQITIDGPNAAGVENVDMVGGSPPTEDTGKYHYDYTIPTDVHSGKFNVKYTATDGTRITIWKDTFEVE